MLRVGIVIIHAARALTQSGVALPQSPDNAIIRAAGDARHSATYRVAADHHPSIGYYTPARRTRVNLTSRDYRAHRPDFYWPSRAVMVFGHARWKCGMCVSVCMCDVSAGNWRFDGLMALCYACCFIGV